MVFRSYQKHCEVCGITQTHDVNNGCWICHQRNQHAIDEEWKKQPLEDKINDLYDRVRDLERHRSNS